MCWGFKIFSCLEKGPTEWLSYRLKINNPLVYQNIGYVIKNVSKIGYDYDITST